MYYFVEILPNFWFSAFAVVFNLQKKPESMKKKLGGNSGNTFLSNSKFAPIWYFWKKKHWVQFASICIIYGIFKQNAAQGNCLLIKPTLRIAILIIPSIHTWFAYLHSTQCYKQIEQFPFVNMHNFPIKLRGNPQEYQCFTNQESANKPFHLLMNKQDTHRID